MKEIDAQKAVRVWQRVQNEARSQGSGQLPALIMEQRELAAMYMQLTQQLAGKKEAAAVQRLSRETQAHMACLKGICLLVTGAVPENRVSGTQKMAADAALRRCYGKALRLLREYEARREDTEYGPVFDRLAQQTREHCCIILELLGKSGK